MRVFVTGADGFIGSHVVESFLNAGHEVKALAQYNSFSNVGWLSATSTRDIEIVLGDIRDPEFIESEIKGFDVVCHLAALIAIPHSYTSPRTYFDVNVMGTANVAHAAMKAGVGKLIHTSTSEVYGSAQFTPITESHPLQAQSPYAASKIGADALIASYVASFSLPAVTIRPFNTFGPRQSLRAVIPSLVAQIAGGEKKLRVGSLNTYRDFTYVSDTASAFVKAAEAPSSLEGQTINLGTGFAVSIQDVVDHLRQISGTDFEIFQDASRIRPAASEVTLLLSDNSKASRMLGWTPSYSGLEGFNLALQETYEWFKSNSHAYALESSRYHV